MMKHVETHRRKEEMVATKMAAMQEKMRLSKLEGGKVVRRAPVPRVPRKPLAIIKQIQDKKILMETNGIEQ